MPRAIEYHAGARADFDDSLAWYLERSIGAAIGFIAAVDEAVEAVARDPQRFALTQAGAVRVRSSDIRFASSFAPTSNAWSLSQSRMRSADPDTGGGESSCGTACGQAG
jgi:hypothetical protein